MYQDLSTQLSSTSGDKFDLRTVEEIFGASLREIWYAEDAVLVGGEVDKVTGRIYGLTLPAGGGATARPGFTPSNAALGGKPTIDCAVSGSRYLRNAAVPADFLPSGYPFMFIIGLSRVIPPVNLEGSSATMRRSATSDWDAVFRVTQTELTYYRFYNGVTRRSIRIDADSGAHLQAGHTDATGTSLYFDSRLYTKVAAGNTPLTGPVDTIALGSNGIGTEIDDYSCAVMGICSSPPPRPDLEALTQWARRTYGTA